MMQLRVKKLNENATLPTKAHEGDAGYDLYSSETVSLKNSAVIPTGISVSIPQGYYGRVASRSGLSFREHVEVGAGVIDSVFRGEIKVLLYRHTNSKSQLQILKGDRIAQIIITPCASPEVVEVNELDETDRGKGGFGSTGK